MVKTNQRIPATTSRPGEKIAAENSFCCTQNSRSWYLPTSDALRARDRSCHSESRALNLKGSRFETQSQRDCALQPRVARNELPWVKVQRESQPQRGCASFAMAAHGGSGM